VTNGLDNPRGLAFAKDGVQFLAKGGRGGTDLLRVSESDNVALVALSPSLPTTLARSRAGRQWGGENGSAALTTSRQYDSIKDIRDEVANARVWGGFHYRGATSAGLKVGEQVARWDLEHAFRPVKDH
jgi:hypothetical protein